MRRRTVAITAASVTVALVLLVAGIVLTLTQTDWGRARVSDFVMGEIQAATHGYITVDRIDGNLLHGATLVGVTITDSARAPFVKADTVVASYRLRDLINKRIYLDNVRIVHPEVVVNRMPGGPWNYDRIFPRDTTLPAGPPGFLSWITLRNVTMVDGHVTSRSPWTPSDTLSKTQRDSVVRYTLGPASRLNVERVTGGFQKVSDFRHIYGTFPLMRLEDPVDARQLIDVSALRMTAEPLKPPAVQVTDLKGGFVILGDSLYFKDITAALSESRLSNGSGRYNFASNDLRLRLHADTVATNDLQWIDPDIPKNGSGRMDFALDWVGATSDYVATNSSLAVAGATLSGRIGVFATDTLSFHDTDMRFRHLDTRTIRQLFPTIISPRQGYLTGRMAVTGGFGAMQVDGDLTFDDPHGGASHIIAIGTVGASGNVVRASDLHITLAPLQVGLARIADPKLPVGGTVTGTVLLNGSTAGLLTATADLVHHDTTGESHVTGTASYADRGRVPFVNADLQLLPLSLTTVGQFAPVAKLRGTLSGPISVTGPMERLAINGDLTTPTGGKVTARGTADLESRPQAYDLTLTTTLFDASEISSNAPHTSISAEASAHGSGFDLATLTATASFAVRSSAYDSVAVDSAIVRLSADSGTLSIDTVSLHVPHGYASGSGEFGLVAGRTGKFVYSASVDSLGALSRFLPAPDTGVVVPRPAILAQRVARADSARAQLARTTQAERAVTGRKLPPIVIDTPRVIPRNALRGSISVNGTATGNIHQFDITGSASGTQLVAFGSAVDSLRADYSWTGALTPQSSLSAQASAVNVLALGFALDTVSLTSSYTKPNGNFKLEIHQDSSRVYNATAQFSLNEDHDELRLDQLNLKFDTTTYASTGPATIRFDSGTTEISQFEIRSPAGGRVYVNGIIPATGDADIELHVTQFEISNITTLLQSDIRARGLVSVDARMRGTRANPSLTGAFGLNRVAYDGHPAPEVHGRINYADETLTADIAAGPEGRSPSLIAHGTIPINLALTGVTGSRVPGDRVISGSIDADSLPLDLIPDISPDLTDLDGRALAKFTVAGTIDHPDINGRITLWDGRAYIAPLGITASDVAANIRLVRDTVIVDSLVVHSNGLVTLTGGIGIKNLARPSFALKLTARDARILDSDMGNLYVSANVAMNGPFDSVSVTGFTHILRGVLYIPESTGKTLVGAGDPDLYAVLDTNNVSMRELFPGQSPLLANLRMNVALMVDRDVFVRSNVANVEVYTDDPLRIGVNRAKQSFLLDGILLSDRGEYRFQSRRFQIRQGSATFINSPELNPTLQITGEYDVQLPTREAIAIRILISGTLDQPKISLESDAQPPISQTDLLSYLAFGRSSSSLLQQEGGGLTTGGSGGSNIVGAGAAFAAKQVGAAALGALTDQAAGEAARSLGADFFNITPADVSLDAGSFLRATQIEFAKYIQTNTFLQLQVRPDPASLERPGFQITHRFNPRKGYRIDASFEPRYLLTEPSFSTNQTPQTTSAFGLFFVREWRY